MHTAQQIIYSEVSHQHRKESQHHISMEEPGLPEDGKRWAVECRTRTGCRRLATSSGGLAE